MAVPPLAAVYQSIVLPALAAEILIAPAPHLPAFVPIGTVGSGFMVATTAVRDAETQLPFALKAST